MKVVNETKQILNDKRGWKRERDGERDRSTYTSGQCKW